MVHIFSKKNLVGGASIADWRVRRLCHWEGFLSNTKRPENTYPFISVSDLLLISFGLVFDPNDFGNVPVLGNKGFLACRAFAAFSFSSVPSLLVLLNTLKLKNDKFRSFELLLSRN